MSRPGDRRGPVTHDKARERLGRLQRRLDYLRGQIDDDNRRGRDFGAAYNWRRAEASALRFYIPILADLLEATAAEGLTLAGRVIVHPVRPPDDPDEIEL